jgi:hypothetical protein
MVNEMLDPKGHLIVRTFVRDQKTEEVTYGPEVHYDNLVVYRGRDYLARRIALDTTDANFFVNFVGVGRVNFPAPDLTQIQLFDVIIYHQIDNKEFSPTARGRIEFTASIEGNEFSTTEVIKEAGLFLSSYTAPGAVAALSGTPYLFSRVTFPDPGFTVFPSTGAISQGFLVNWSVSF